MAHVNHIYIAISGSKGDVTIMAFITQQHESGEGPGWVREPTPENINKEIAKAKIDCVAWRIIEKGDIPTDRIFRNAWKLTDKIEIDMPKAREIHKSKLRMARRPLLEKLDIDYMRAIENGDVAWKQKIIQEKKLLRDITDDPRINAAQTVDDLVKVKIDG